MLIAGLGKVSSHRWTPAVHRAAPVASSEVTDQLSLGERPEDLPAPPPPPPPGPLKNPPGREDGITRWATVRHQLKDGNTASLEALCEEARELEDPVVRRLATRILDQHAGASDTLEGRILRLGPEVGLNEWLARQEAHRRPDDVPALLEKIEGDPKPFEEARLRPLVHLVTSLPQGEARESVATQLETWWGEGRFQVTREGRTVLPGALDLRELLAQRPPVRGTAIEIPSGPPSELEEQFDTDEWRATLKAREQLEGRLEELLELAPKLEARGAVTFPKDRSWGLYFHYHKLIEHFPDAFEERHLEDILLPMCRASGRGNALVKELCGARPDLLRPAVEGYKRLTEEQGYLAYNLPELMAQLPPDERDLQFMAERLSFPQLRFESGNLLGEEAQHWIPRLVEAQRRQPELLDDLVLPGPGLAPIPFREAMLEQYLRDSKLKPEELLTGDPGGVLELVGDGEGVTRRLKDIVAEGLNRSAPRFLREPETAALFLLSVRDSQTFAEVVTPRLVEPELEAPLEKLIEPVRVAYLESPPPGASPGRLMAVAQASPTVAIYRQRAELIASTTDADPDRLLDQVQSALPPSEHRLDPDAWGAIDLVWRRGNEAQKARLHELVDPHLDELSVAMNYGHSYLAAELVYEKLEELKGELAQAGDAQEVLRLTAEGAGLSRHLRPEYQTEFLRAVADRLDGLEAMPNLSSLARDETLSPIIATALVSLALEHTPAHLSVDHAVLALSVLYRTEGDYSGAEYTFKELVPQIKSDEELVSHLAQMKLSEFSSKAAEVALIEQEEDRLWVGDIAVPVNS